MLFANTVINSVSTISDESSYIASAESMDDFSNDQDSVEVDDSKTNKNEIYSVQDPIKKCNGSNYTQIIITEDKANSILLELQNSASKTQISG